MRVVIGSILLAMPFILLAYIAVLTEGWKSLLVVFGITILLLGIVLLGAYLLAGG